MWSSQENLEPKKILGIRLAAVWETLIFLLSLSLISYFFGSGNRFLSYSIHPFWIIVLLMSSLYGTVEGVFAAALSTFVLYYNNLPDMQAEEDLFQYQFRIMLHPMLWVITAYVLGEIRLSLQANLRQVEEYALHTESKAEKIAAEYAVLKEQNSNLSLALSSREETAASAFQALKEMEVLEPGKVIMGVAPIVRISLKPTKYSVYAMGPNGFEAVTSEGWKPEDPYKRRIDSTTPLFQALTREKRLISIINKSDRSYLDNEGVLAAPLIDASTNELFGMIKIEEIPFQNLNLVRLETFKSVCDLIGKSYANSKKHRELRDSNLYSIDGNLLSHSFYQLALPYLHKIQELNRFTLKEFKITLPNNPKKQIEIKNLKNLLPPLTLLFQGKQKAEVQIVVPLGQEANVKEILQLLKPIALSTEEVSPTGSIDG